MATRRWSAGSSWTVGVDLPASCCSTGSARMKTGSRSRSSCWCSRMATTIGSAGRSRCSRPVARQSDRRGVVQRTGAEGNLVGCVMSVLQVAQISELLQATNMAWNRSWDGGPVALTGESLAAKPLPGGMHITILSPERRDVQILAVQWGREQARRGLGDAGSPDSDEAVPAPPGGKAATKSSSRRRDSGRGPPDVNEAREHAVHRRSQLVERSEHRLPRGAGGQVAAGRRRCTCRRPLPLDCCTAGPARARTTAPGCLRGPARWQRSQLIASCSHCWSANLRYLSTDGTAFQHPDRETIARILVYGRASPDRPLTLVFNHRTATTEVWANPQLQSRYSYRALYPEQNGAGIKVQL